MAFLPAAHFVELRLSGTSGPSFLSGYNVPQVTHLFQSVSWLMSCPDKMNCSSHPQSYVVSLLSPFLSILYYCWIGGMPFDQNASTHRSFQYPLRN